MIFDPVSYLHLADELASESARSNAGTRAARIRTAYGRLYYGLFLSIREAIVARHGVPPRRVEHGALISHLQHSTLDGAVRKLGREMQKLYSLRRQADYELAPAPQVRAQLEDAVSARILAREVMRFVRQIPHMDFTPIAHLFTLR